MTSTVIHTNVVDLSKPSSRNVVWSSWKRIQIEGEWKFEYISFGAAYRIVNFWNTNLVLYMRVEKERGVKFKCPI